MPQLEKPSFRSLTFFSAAAGTTGLYGVVSAWNQHFISPVSSGPSAHAACVSLCILVTALAMGILANVINTADKEKYIIDEQEWRELDVLMLRPKLYWARASTKARIAIIFLSAGIAGFGAAELILLLQNDSLKMMRGGFFSGVSSPFATGGILFIVGLMGIISVAADLRRPYLAKSLGDQDWRLIDESPAELLVAKEETQTKPPRQPIKSSALNKTTFLVGAGIIATISTLNIVDSAFSKMAASATYLNLATLGLLFLVDFFIQQYETLTYKNERERHNIYVRNAESYQVERRACSFSATFSAMLITAFGVVQCLAKSDMASIFGSNYAVTPGICGWFLVVGGLLLFNEALPAINFKTCAESRFECA